MPFGRVRRGFRRLGIRVQLVALFAMLLAGSLGFYSFAIYRYISSTHQEEFDASLYNYAIDVSRSLDASVLVGSHFEKKLLAEAEKILPFAIGETYLQVLTAGGRVAARSRNLEE